MTEMPWVDLGGFHNWYLRQIDEALSSQPIVKVSRVSRSLAEDDFGFSKKTITTWRDKLPEARYPDGRKLMGIVFSAGFVFFTEHAQKSIIFQWLEIEVEQVSDDLSDEFLSTLKTLLEKSPSNFLLECVAEIRPL
jgi:hypothetical protein